MLSATKKNNKQNGAIAVMKCLAPFRFLFVMHYQDDNAFFIFCIEKI